MPDLFHGTLLHTHLWFLPWIYVTRAKGKGLLSVYVFTCCMPNSGRKNITRLACGTQIFFFFTLGVAECILLILRAYDQYVAVCNALRYAVIMNHSVCLQMAMVSWLGGVLASTARTSYTMSLPICVSREIHHFFCEMPAIMKISCKDTSTYELVVFVMGIGFFIVPFGLIMASYTFIFLTVLRMKSPQGRNKVLAPCSSHLTVVSFYLGPCVYMYMTPGFSHTPEQEHTVSVFCTVLTPMLNPLVYSLRNKDVVGAFQKILRKHPTSKQNTEISGGKQLSRVKDKDSRNIHKYIYQHEELLWANHIMGFH